MGQKDERMFNIFNYICGKNTTFTGSKKNYMNVQNELTFFLLTTNDTNFTNRKGLRL
jgi:hypothetical protein